jgi:hypothetical protein
MVVLVLDRPRGLDWLMQPAINHHIYLGRLNAAPAYAGDLYFSAQAERSRSSLQQIYRCTGVYQRGHEHVAADTRKAFQIADAHVLPHARPPF